MMSDDGLENILLFNFESPSFVTAVRALVPVEIINVLVQQLEQWAAGVDETHFKLTYQLQKYPYAETTGEFPSVYERNHWYFIVPIVLNNGQNIDIQISCDRTHGVLECEYVGVRPKIPQTSVQLAAIPAFLSQAD